MAPGTAGTAVANRHSHIKTTNLTKWILFHIIIKLSFHGLAQYSFQYFAKKFILKSVSLCCSFITAGSSHNSLNDQNTIDIIIKYTLHSSVIQIETTETIGLSL